MKRYSVLMIDLDGTLLDIEVAFFLGPMVQAMHGCFEDLLNLEAFTHGLFQGIDEIREKPRPEEETNQDGFTAAFSTLTGVQPGEVVARFDRFYRDIFPTLNGHARPRSGAGRFVAEAAQRGYRLVLATNPIFPTSAIVERLKWARMDPGLFEFIPGLETMGSCKPQVSYFLDLADRIGADPGCCLMVGNDVQHDLPASDAGMGTFLVEGHVVDRGTGDRVPGGRGTFEELGEMLGLGT